MQLQGSCHCRAVTFEFESKHPYPFNLCYCSICRKTAGGGGFAINLSGDYDSMRIEGREHLRVYQAYVENEEGERERSDAQRNFCGECGSALWLWDPRWPELVHPHASAIDTALPTPPERVHFMIGSKASWVHPHVSKHDRSFDAYPQESIAEWHQRLGLEK